MNKKRLPLIAGNWKMYKIPIEAENFVIELDKKVSSFTDREVLVCPTIISIPRVSEILRDSQIRVGVQNVFYEKEGPYTGEISPWMLTGLNVSYVICGHSERRQIFGENNKTISLKIQSVINCGMTPIFCIGEKSEEREKGLTFSIIEQQLIQGLSGIQTHKLVIAYEPVWAIGTGKNATPQQAQEVHSFIRKKLSEIYSKDFSEYIRILYGGSVKPDNIDSLMAQPDIDGVLVGGASLKIDSFARIIDFKV
ncbi:MAG: triose-phosphate isomerase [Candidatus Omnitrophica bacterium]|jgi:triosephosphate isomerase|nr:triose-phosphate isomerase [Candidatus Omnitrophota bacterium]